MKIKVEVKEEETYVMGHHRTMEEVQMRAAIKQEEPSLDTITDGSSKRNPPERCLRPLYSRDPTQEDLTVPHHDQREEQMYMKVEVKEEEVEPCAMDTQRSTEVVGKKTTMKQEEEPPDVITDGSSKRNPPERCPHPLYSRDPTQEHLTVPHQDQGEELKDVKVEIKREEQETYMRGAQQSMEVEGPLYSRDPTQEHHEIPQTRPLYSQDSTQEHHEIPQTRPLYSRDPTQEEHNYAQRDQGEELNYIKVVIKEEMLVGGAQQSTEEGEGGPLYSRDSTQEEHNYAQLDQGEDLGVIRVVVEEEDEEEETLVSGAQQSTEEGEKMVKSKREESSLHMDTNGHVWNISEGHVWNISDGQVWNISERQVCNISEGQVWNISEGQVWIICEGHVWNISEGRLILSPSYDITQHVPRVTGITQNHQRSTDPSNVQESSDISQTGTPDTPLRSHSAERSTDPPNPKESSSRPGGDHTGKRSFSCPKCGKSFAEIAHLEKHQRRQTDKRPLSCSACGKRFADKASLLLHQAIYDEPYRFVESGKKFNLKGTPLKPTHKKNHTDELPYSCSKYGKGFITEASLVSHQKPPFKCFECGRKFNSKKKLDKHEKNHPGEFPSYSCLVCGKSFPEKENLRSHQIAHPGDRRFSCPECGNGFVRKRDLILHQKIHIGVRSYLCSECGKCFPVKRVLLAHQRIHTGERPYKCWKCGKSFKYRLRLRSHQRRKLHRKPFIWRKSLVKGRPTTDPVSVPANRRATPFLFFSLHKRK